MKTVIMAGGRGTRIASIAQDVPKPMIKIKEKPILEYEIESIRDQGFRDIIITVGYLGNVIMDYFKEGNGISPATGKPFGVNIQYFVEDVPLGNAGALFKLREELKEDFFLVNADSLFEVDLNRMLNFHKKCGALVTILTHPNNHPYDSGLIITNSNHSVYKWISKEEEHPQYYKNRVNAGMHIVSAKLLDQTINTQKIDLDRQLLKPLAGTEKMYAYDSSEYIFDMGTPERFSKVCKDFESGIVQKRTLQNKQKAIFLDRDGTINKYVGFLRKIDEFELLPGVAEAIKKINNSEYLVIVVSNQPVIARGEVTQNELDDIHNKMETLLGEVGAFINAIYFCPHHPDKGFVGEIEALKIECNCRKPEPGMLLNAKDDYNLDLKQCWMVGDSQNDIMAGKNAGCKTALIGQAEYGQDMSVDSLIDFAERIINEHGE